MTHDEQLNEAAKLLGIEGHIPPDPGAASWCEMAAAILYELARRMKAYETPIELAPVAETPAEQAPA